MSAKTPVDPARSVAEIFREGSRIDAAIRKAAREAWLAHKREGVPIPVWKDGKTAWIAPDDIEVPDEPMDTSGRRDDD